jgi:hypothetical protein
MKRSNATVLLSMLLSAGLFAGCATASPAEGDSDIVVNEPATTKLAGATDLRVERRAGESAFELVNAPGFRKLQDGVWEQGEGASKQQVVVGEAGHQWLAEQTANRIEALRAKIDESTAAEPLLQEIDQLEQVRDQMTSAVAGERSRKEATASLTTSCTFSPYTGPSGAVTSPPLRGAAALAQAVCSGGCVAFTVRSQACCGGYCSPLATQTNVVCSSPLLMGSIRAGYGSGYASVNITPPNVTQTNTSFICN